jgi:hypothetical protein
MPGQFGRFEDPPQPTDSVSKPRFTFWANDYAIRHPFPGSVVQGFLLGGFITILGLLKDLPSEPELEPILIIGASTVLLTSLCMVPVNMWRRARTQRLIDAASLRQDQSGSENP